MWRKEGSEAIVGQFACLLGEAVHAFAYLNVDMVAVDKEGRRL
jgi:hypothetical protein